MKRLQAVTMSLLLLALAAPCVNASPVLDQFYVPSTTTFPSEPIFNDFVGNEQHAQTFTVGLGGLLTEIDVLVYRQDPGALDLLFDLRPTTGSGFPIFGHAMDLANLAAPAADVPFVATWVAFDVTSFGIYVTPGEVLAIVLNTPFVSGSGMFPFQYRWPVDVPGTYAGGSQFIGNDTNPWLQDVGIQSGFRTYVDPAPAVPEPASIVLLGTSLLGFAGRAASRRGLRR